MPDGCVLELDLLAAPPETSGLRPAGDHHRRRQAAAAARGRRRDPPRRRGPAGGRADRAGADSGRRGGPGAGAAGRRSPPSAMSSRRWRGPRPIPGTLSYYLASAFREVWMQPSGTVGLVGFATNALFLRDALDKAGIEAQFVARGEYKSAANLFTQDRYTDAHREADSRLLDSLHGQVWQAVAESRAHRRRRRSTRWPTRRRCCATTPSPVGWSTASASATRPMRGSVNSLARRVFRRRPATPTATTRRRGCTCRATPGPPRRGPVPQMPSIPGRKSKPTIAVVTAARPDRQRPRRSAGAAVRQLQRGRRHHRRGAA